jgi:hypothetical protein
MQKMLVLEVPEVDMIEENDKHMNKYAARRIISNHRALKSVILIGYKYF